MNPPKRIPEGAKEAVRLRPLVVGFGVTSAFLLAFGQRRRMGREGFEPPKA